MVFLTKILSEIWNKMKGKVLLRILKLIIVILKHVKQENNLT